MHSKKNKSGDKMESSLSKIELKQYISRQLENIFPDKYKFEGEDIVSAIDVAFQRTEYCFKHIAVSQYTHDGKVWFDHLHSDQYSSFLYFLANSLWKNSENKPICDKLMALNKCLNGLFISYKCNMPSVFFLNHPVGSFIGNAEFHDFLVVSQNVTINTKFESSEGPKIGRAVILKAGSIITGETCIGNGCSIEANTVLHNVNIPDNSTVFTNTKGEIEIEMNKNECYVQQVFNVKCIELERL